MRRLSPCCYRIKGRVSGKGSIQLQRQKCAPTRAQNCSVSQCTNVCETPTHKHTVIFSSSDLGWLDFSLRGLVCHQRSK